MKYKVSERCKHFVIIDFEHLGFIEIYRNGTMYTNIKFNGNIKTFKKILRIANWKRLKNKLKF